MGWGRGVRGVRVTVPFYKSTVSACIILLISNVHQCHIILALIKYEIGHTLQKNIKFLFRIKLLYSYCHGIFFFGRLYSYNKTVEFVHENNYFQLIQTNRNLRISCFP